MQNDLGQEGPITPETEVEVLHPGFGNDLIEGAIKNNFIKIKVKDIASVKFVWIWFSSGYNKVYFTKSTDDNEYTYVPNFFFWHYKSFVKELQAVNPKIQDKGFKNFMLYYLAAILVIAIVGAILHFGFKIF